RTATSFPEGWPRLVDGNASRLSPIRVSGGHLCRERMARALPHSHREWQTGSGHAVGRMAGRRMVVLLAATAALHSCARRPLRGPRLARSAVGASPFSADAGALRRKSVKLFPNPRSRSVEQKGDVHARPDTTKVFGRLRCPGAKPGGTGAAA